MTKKALYVDDLRDLPENTDEYTWELSRDGFDAIYKLTHNEYDLVSLDHDIATFLGYKEITGYDIAIWLSHRKNEGLYIPPVITCHSANCVGIENIESVIARYLT